ncbi:MAG: replication-associated recombination protein A, partial [Bacillota bacterium]
IYNILIQEKNWGDFLNLFEQRRQENKEDKPLAFRMRPENLEQVYGQDDIIGEGKLLNRAIKADRVQSLILYGPPGTGKTSIAQVIARQTESDFLRINAVTSGVKELREVIEQAKKNLSLHNKKTILFIDEIHRFNKSQQDALLPAVEEGIIVMIGATTENPYFEVNSPLLSRSRIFRLNSLSEKDIINILKNALNNQDKGLGGFDIDISDSELELIAKLSNGDARTALNALELAVLTTPPDEKGIIKIDSKIIAESLQKKALNYDKDGDGHYDTISAFIKSMRGSDPDAALFWLAKMLEAGEDPKFIVRRVIVHAAEDVGLADPQALQIATAAAKAVEFVGMPEARIPLAEAVLYIATAPKSNSVVTGIDSALNYVRTNNVPSVPLHLRDAHYKGSKDLGHGLEYKYPHNYPNNYVSQQYMPDGLEGLKFYNPGTEGKEKYIKECLHKLKMGET